MKNESFLIHDSSLGGSSKAFPLFQGKYQSLQRLLGILDELLLEDGEDVEVLGAQEGEELFVWL